MINEENFKQVIFEYASEKYRKQFQEFYDKFYGEFPYKYEGLDEELNFKNFIDWLINEKTLPATGKTIVEEFVDEYPEIDEEMKQKLLQMKNVINSEFIVISKKHLNLKFKDIKSNETYNVVLYADNPNINVNSFITGRIHPFGNYYRTCGVFLIRNSPFILDPDIFMESFNEAQIKKAENIILLKNSKISTIINKYPAQWVNGICEEFSISIKGKKSIKAEMIASKIQEELQSILNSIPEESKKALKIVLNNGGVVKYNKLQDYDDEITFWWSEKPPNSTIGLLRLKGLLAVGKMPMSGKMYNIAIIPDDIRKELKNLLNNPKDDAR